MSNYLTALAYLAVPFALEWMAWEASLSAGSLRRSLRLLQLTAASCGFDHLLLAVQGISTTWDLVTATIAIATVVSLIFNRDALAEASRELWRLKFTHGALIYLVGVNGRWLSVSDSLCEFFGRSRESLLSQRGLQNLTRPGDAANKEAQLIEQCLSGEIDYYQIEKQYLTAQGYQWAIVNASIIRAKSPFFLNRLTPIQYQKSLEAQLREQATRDGLTGLHNRAFATEALEQLCTQFRCDRQPFAVLCLDLDGFKPINDNYGHLAGDYALRAVATRLTAVIRQDAVVARLGGDEFLVLVSKVDQMTALGIVRRLIEAVQQPLIWNTTTGQERDLPIRISVGCAIAGERINPDELLSLADHRLYEAKRSGAGFSLGEAFDSEVIERSLDLPQAISNRDLCLHYQPIVDLQTLQTAGYEALVRWEHPKQGLLYPDQFLPLAAKLGLMPRLCECVFFLATTEFFSSAVRSDLFLAINANPQSLGDRPFGDFLLRILGQQDSRRVHVEITEDLAIALDGQAGSQIKRLFARLSALQVGVVFDDFPRQFSVENALQLLRVLHGSKKSIKIDRSIVEDLNSPAYQAVVKAAIELARGTNMSTVAEGVESLEQVQLLRLLGVDYGQGYYFSRPKPLSDFEV